jgi:hypothetical protein
VVRALLILPLVALGCSEPVELTHAAYVWQRSWTPAVSAAVQAAPADELRVLAVEFERGELVRVDVDVSALAASRRAVVAVARVDGARLPDGLNLEPLHAVVARWRAGGVRVVGVEVDHDCAAGALGNYADWLAGERARSPGERWSITALPAWTGAGALPRLTGLADEVVLQVHAVRAPSIFEAGRARAWLEAFSVARGPGQLRVALPTYRVEAGAALPDEVQAFLTELREDPVPGLVGVSWFRLPVEGDRSAWSGATLRAVIDGAALQPKVVVHRQLRGIDVYDLVAENVGNVDAPWPFLVVGAAEDMDLRTEGPPIRPGERVVVGWMRGSDAWVAH